MQTVITYEGGTPTITGTVTLFNSVTAFPPGGLFHLLNQQWFQWSLTIASADGTATGTVTGSFSNDRGVTWVDFYTETTAAGNDPLVVTEEDEVYVGVYKDIRFQYLNAVQAPSTFTPNIALNDCKPTSKITVNDVLVDG